MRRMRKATIWLTAAALAVGPMAGGCATDKAVISQANESHTELSAAVIGDPQIENYMARLGGRIVREAKAMDEAGEGPKAHVRGEDTGWMFENVQWHMVGSPTLNAFTTGGQHIYIYSELFNTSKTEDEFAAVCAHEFAHIYSRHVQAGMNRQYGILAGAAAVAVGGAAVGAAVSDDTATGALTGGAAGGAVGLGVGQFLGMGFTRRDEDEADKYGFRFYTKAGWDPAQFAGFFQTMIDKGYDTTPEIASDHPKLANRVKATEKRAAELPASAKQWRKPNTATPGEFKALQKRAAAAAKEIERKSGKEVKAAELMLAAFPSCVAPTATERQVKAREAITAATKGR